MIITVDEIEERQGTRGPYWIVTYNGNKTAYVWDAKVASALFEGNRYEVTIRSGKFPKITEAKPVEDAPRGSGRITPEIVAALAIEALKAAVSFRPPQGNARPVDVLVTAGVFWDWLWRKVTELDEMPFDVVEPESQS